MSAEAEDNDASTPPPAPTTLSPTGPPLPEPATLADAVWAAITMPGIGGPGARRLLDLTFVGLFVTLGLLLVASGLNIHVAALLVVAGALFATLKWFIAETDRLAAEEAASRGAGDDGTVVRNEAISQDSKKTQ
ncbi:hypothetical protein HK405_006874 [Cladochytrium tenue]|nr:hypothetical protein HK405_006874 [Cladochytrium tenue]